MKVLNILLVVGIIVIAVYTFDKLNKMSDDVKYIRNALEKNNHIIKAS